MVRYYCSRKVENDILGGFFFLVNSRKVLRLSENGNGDICVVDYIGKVVFVVYVFGGLWFKYIGNKMIYKKRIFFKFFDIVNDGNFNIFIDDDLNKVVYIIDCDGNFICYLEYLCIGGISVDIE